jgi:hypothetical protein
MFRGPAACPRLVCSPATKTLSGRRSTSRPSACCWAFLRESQLRDAHNRLSVLPVPVGDSSMPFCLWNCVGNLCEQHLLRLFVPHLPSVNYVHCIAIHFSFTPHPFFFFRKIKCWTSFGTKLQTSCFLFLPTEQPTMHDSRTTITLQQRNAEKTQCVL